MNDVRNTPCAPHAGVPASNAVAAGDAKPVQAFSPYLGSLLGGLLAAFVMFYIALLALQATGHLPPPPFSNNLCVDEKLSFMREHQVVSPNLLVIGSSVAWRHFDSATVARMVPGTRPLNGGFCGLIANQSIHAGNWLLDRNPTVQQVVMIVSPEDFSGCRASDGATFDRKDVDAFVYEGRSPWWFYMRYFSPRSLLRNASRVKEQRANNAEFEPLVFTPFGDGPLATTKTREVGDQPNSFDPTCFVALQSLAGRLQREGRSLLVVTTPVHPDWKASKDPKGAFIGELDAQISRVLKPAGGRFWNAAVEWNAAREAFTDVIHLRWSAAQNFSAALAQHIEPPSMIPTANVGQASGQIRRSAH